MTTNDQVFVDAPRVSKVILADVPIFAVTGAFLAVCLAIFAKYDLWTGTSYIPLNANLNLMAVFVVAVGDIVWRLARHRPTAPIAFLIAAYGRRAWAGRVLARLPLLVIAVVFLPLFSQMKSIIPLFNERLWDAEIMAWDRALFFGRDAWQALQPLFGYPRVTALLALLYHAWILLVYGGTVFMLFHRSTAPLARRYFLSTILVWTLLGVVLATVLASLGPCFVGPILGDPTFDAQLAYLQAADAQIPVLTLDVQASLLAGYHEGYGGLGSGISAMPSLHVAVSFLFWLAIRKVSHGAGWAFFAWFVAMWVASVHLGYHYAMDGVVSVIATALIWWASGAVLQAWDRWLAEGPRRRAGTRRDPIPHRPVGQLAAR